VHLRNSLLVFARCRRVGVGAEVEPNASEVRCWPHHFDIATLIEVARGKTIGVGMEPGDVYYDEPYFYVNLHPRPAAPPTALLGGHGTWHTHEWIGAVLPVSRLKANLDDDVRAFSRFGNRGMPEPSRRTRTIANVHGQQQHRDWSARCLRVSAHV
jgi:hypothetical protein